MTNTLTLPLNFGKQYKNSLDTQYNLLRVRSEILDPKGFALTLKPLGSQKSVSNQSAIHKKTMSNPAQSLPVSDNNTNSASQETTSGGSEEIRWEVVARAAGLMPATIMAGRLQAEGIPTRTWQEGAGRALGLTVGILGTGYVAVPEEFVDEAREILADESQVDWDEEEE